MLMQNLLSRFSVRHQSLTGVKLSVVGSVAVPVLLTAVHKQIYCVLGSIEGMLVMYFQEMGFLCMPSITCTAFRSM